LCEHKRSQDRVFAFCTSPLILSAVLATDQSVLTCTHVSLPGSEKVFKADLVLLAMGFVGPERQIVEELSVDLDQRGNVSTPNSKYNTSIPKLYAAGGIHFCVLILGKSSLSVCIPVSRQSLVTLGLHQHPSESCACWVVVLLQSDHVLACGSDRVQRCVLFMDIIMSSVILVYGSNCVMLGTVPASLRLLC